MVTFVLKTMEISCQDLKNDRQWRSSTGLNQSQFSALREGFARANEQVHGETILECKSGSTQESIFWTYDELLFFVLFGLKCGFTYDVLGLVFGCEGSTAQRNQKSALEVVWAERMILG